MEPESSGRNMTRNRGADRAVCGPPTPNSGILRVRYLGCAGVEATTSQATSKIGDAQRSGAGGISRYTTKLQRKFISLLGSRKPKYLKIRARFLGFSGVHPMQVRIDARAYSGVIALVRAGVGRRSLHLADFGRALLPAGRSAVVRSLRLCRDAPYANRVNRRGDLAGQRSAARRAAGQRYPQAQAAHAGCLFCHERDREPCRRSLGGCLLRFCRHQRG